MSESTVAVVVTCYNQELWIRQALDSIAAQTVVPDQIIVVDGHSSDRSVLAVQDWMQESGLAITLIRQPSNRGLCANLNRGLAEVDADYFIPFYGDDWFEPHRVEVLREALDDGGPEVAVACGSIREVDQYGEPIVDHDFAPRLQPILTGEPLDRVAHLVRGNVIPAPAVMVRTRYVREAGGYDESITIDDYDLWLRLLGTYRLRYVPSIVANLRLVPSSITRSKSGRSWFLLSEATVLHRQLGQSSEIDRIIAVRVLRLCLEMADSPDQARLEAILRLAEDAVPGSGLGRVAGRGPTEVRKSVEEVLAGL